MLKDYSDGRLGNKPFLHRAVVLDVDTVGGQLESSPPNPQGSIRARIYTNGLDSTTPDFALTIFHPFLPFNMMPPVLKGEHVYVTFEDPDMKSNGMWTGTIPVHHRGQDFSDPDENKTYSQDSSQVFEGSSANQSVVINKDLEFGGNTQQESRKDTGPIIFNSEENSFFSEKSVLIIGDETISGNIESELKSLLVSKNVKNLVFNSKRGSKIEYWQNQLDVLLENNNPDILLIFSGLNDNEESFSETKVLSVLNKTSSVPSVVWIGPVKLSYSTNIENKEKDQILEEISNRLNSLLSPKYIETRDICPDEGRSEDGRLFSGLSSKSFVETVILRVERMFS